MEQGRLPECICVSGGCYAGVSKFSCLFILIDYVQLDIVMSSTLGVFPRSMFGGCSPSNDGLTRVPDEWVPFCPLPLCVPLGIPGALLRLS